MSLSEVEREALENGATGLSIMMRRPRESSLPQPHGSRAHVALPMVETVKASELPERFCSFKRGGQTVYVIVREVNEITQKVYRIIQYVRGFYAVGFL